MPIQCSKCQAKSYKKLQLVLEASELNWYCDKCIDGLITKQHKFKCYVCKIDVNKNNIIKGKTNSYVLCSKCFMEVYNDGIRARKF